MPLFTFVGVMVACATVTKAAGLADMVVGVFEEKKRIDDQVGRLKKWKSSSFHTQTVVVTPQVKEDHALVGSKDLELTDDLDDDEYIKRMTDTRTAYVAQQKALQDGTEFEKCCDRCHVCGSPDPMSKGAQHRMREKMGINGATNTIVKAYVESQKGSDEGGWFDGAW